MRKLSVLTILVGSMLVAEEAARADPLDASALKGDQRALPNPDRRGKPSRPLSGAPDGVAVTGHALRRENGDACRRQPGGILGRGRRDAAFRRPLCRNLRDGASL